MVGNDLALGVMGSNDRLRTEALTAEAILRNLLCFLLPNFERSDPSRDNGFIEKQNFCFAVDVL